MSGCSQWPPGGTPLFHRRRRCSAGLRRPPDRTGPVPDVVWDEAAAHYDGLAAGGQDRDIVRNGPCGRPMS